MLGGDEFLKLEKRGEIEKRRRAQEVSHPTQSILESSQMSSQHN